MGCSPISSTLRRFKAPVGDERRRPVRRLLRQPVPLLSNPIQGMVCTVSCGRGSRSHLDGLVRTAHRFVQRSMHWPRAMPRATGTHTHTPSTYRLHARLGRDARTTATLASPSGAYPWTPTGSPPTAPAPSRCTNKPPLCASSPAPKPAVSDEQTHGNLRGIYL